MIALLCPTRGRPQQLRRMIESAFATAKEFCIYIYVADDDPEMDAYNELSNSYGFEDDVIWCHGIDYPTVHKWNYLATEAKSLNPELYMLAADDIIFATPRWETALIEHYSKLEKKIHCWALQDSRDKDGVPHPIVSREWIEAMGWFLPPYFLHWKVDMWTNEIATANKCFTHMRDYMLIHDKPNDRGQPDETHLNIRRNGWLQRDITLAETCGYLLEHEKQRLARVIQ